MRTALERPQWEVLACTRVIKVCNYRTRYPSIPDDLIFYGILNRLPVKSLFRFSCVSKLWYATFRDPKFTKSHLIHAKENSSSTLIGLFMDSRLDGRDYIFGREDGLYFSFHTEKWTSRVGDCNGLFCFRSRFGFEICNPNTREFLYRPFPPLPLSDCHISYGFGFDPLTNEYKLVQIVLGKRNFNRCMVYTIGENNHHQSWRDVTVSSKLSNYVNGNDDLGGIADEDSALYSTKALHWFSRRTFKIMSFDIHRESFTLIEGPCWQPYLRHCNCYLIEWQRSVCLAFHNPNGKRRVYMYKFTKRGNWDRTVVLLPNALTCTIYFVGGESSLLCWDSGEGPLSVFKPNDSGSVVNKIFSLSPSLDCSSSVFQCKYVNHIENLVSLKTLVPEVQVKYASSL